MPARRPSQRGTAPQGALARARADAIARRSAKNAARAAERASDPNKPLNRRQRLFRRVMQIGPIRGYYTRRLMRYMAKSKKKGRPLPDQLADLDEYLSRLPAKQRRSVLEASLSGELDARAGRDVRRAASRQSRQKGSAGGGQRPGMPPVPGVRRPRPQ
jgi:hypothetical protein